MRPVIRDKMSMSAIVSREADKDSVIAELLRVIEKRRSANGCGSIVSARAAIARETGISPGTLENVQRGRTKGLRGFIRDRLTDFAVHEIQKEMARLQHDLQIAMQIADRLDADAVISAQAALDEARAFLNKAKG